MEKRKPHCPLPIVHAMVKSGKSRLTKTASDSALLLGFDYDEVINIVIGLTMNDFYKSMTSYVDHRIWQDVYRPLTKTGQIYLKLMVIDEVVIVSFKEL